MVLSLFLPSAILLEDGFVEVDDRAVRGVLGTAELFELSAVGLSDSLAL